MMTPQPIVLVNERDEEIGVMEKLEVHQKGLLHRAFSVFIFDKKGRMLLQRRSAKKYHGAMLWTNTCCSHPYPGENVDDAAQRRLKEEMGFSAPLKKLFVFTYNSPVENNLIEHEIDHVYVGEFSGTVSINPDEVDSYTFSTLTDIKFLLKEQPTSFTTWFRIAFPKIESWWLDTYGK